MKQRGYFLSEFKGSTIKTIHRASNSTTACIVYKVKTASNLFTGYKTKGGCKHAVGNYSLVVDAQFYTVACSFAAVSEFIQQFKHTL